MILKMTLANRQGSSYYFHFTSMETGALEVNDLLKVTQHVSVKSLAPNSEFLTSHSLSTVASSPHNS
jgi:hypothetical protein